MSTYALDTIDRGELLKELYREARLVAKDQAGPKLVPGADPQWPESYQLTAEEAALELATAPGSFIGQLAGKVLNVDLAGATVDVGAYNRQNGDLAGELALARCGHREAALLLCLERGTDRELLEEALGARYGKAAGAAILARLRATYFDSESFEYADNLRIADDSPAALARYAAKRQKGCCGFHDETLTVAGRVYQLGFNYGH